MKAFFRRPRIWRFGLRSLFVLLTVVAIWCGYYASKSQSRRPAIAHLPKLGGATWEQGQIPDANSSGSASVGKWFSVPYKRLVSGLFGDFEKQIVAIDLSDASISEKDLARLTPLGELRWLTVTGKEISDSASQYVSKFEQLSWLDLSGTSISITGIRGLKGLSSLEWLNVSDTQIAESEIQEIQSMFPQAQIGFATTPVPIQYPTASVESLNSISFSQQTLWDAVKANPYSTAAVDKYVASIGRSAALQFSQWYISAVYRASRKGMEPLLIIEVYDGTSQAFRLGCLLIFDSDGKLLREISQERVHWSLGGPTSQANWRKSQHARILGEQQLAASMKVIDLNDLTGDGFDEIPTQRWSTPNGDSESGGESASIYTSASIDIPCLLCISFPSSARLVQFFDLSTAFPNLVFRDLKSHKLFLQSPCYARTPNGASILNQLPQRTLASFVWSEKDGCFLGPTEGPQKKWQLYRHQEE